jgi:hypothetical protein
MFTPYCGGDENEAWHVKIPFPLREIGLPVN